MSRSNLRGIYKIICLSNNKVYIGKSIDLHYRWLKHLSDLRLNQHHSKYMQNSFNKYGEQNFIFEIIVQNSNFSYADLQDLEKQYIEQYGSFLDGFNETAGGEGTTQRQFSKETRKKLSDNVKGEKNPMYGKVGELNPNARLSKREAMMIYVYVNSDHYPRITQEAVAQYFGVGRDVVKRIKSLKQHKYLKEEITPAMPLWNELLVEFKEIFKDNPQAKSRRYGPRKV